MSEQAVSLTEKKIRYYVNFPELRYAYGEAEIKGRSYVRVTLDGRGRHLRRRWFRADGAMATREELQYDDAGRLVRLEAFDERGARKGFTVFNYPEVGRVIKHRFDAKSKPTEVIEEHYNVRGFILWEKHQQVVEHGSHLETVTKVEYTYPEPGIRKGDYFDEDAQATHTIVDHFNAGGDLIATEKFDTEGELYLHSEYVFDAGGRVLERIDTDGGGAIVARVNYQG